MELEIIEEAKEALDLETGCCPGDIFAVYAPDVD